MDIAIIFQKLGQFFAYFCSKEFIFCGYPITIGSVLVFCGLSAILISLLKGMAD